MPPAAQYLGLCVEWLWIVWESRGVITSGTYWERKTWLVFWKLIAQQQNMESVLGVVLEKTNEIQWWGVNSVLLTIGRSDRRENKKEFHKANFHLLPRECFFLGRGRMQVVAHFCPKHCLKSEFLLWGHCCLSELSNKCSVNSNLGRFGPCCDHAALSPPTSFPYASSSAQPLPAYPFWALQILLPGLYTETTEAGDGWWLPVYSCIEHSNYPAFLPCVPVHCSL